MSVNTRDVYVLGLEEKNFTFIGTNQNLTFSITDNKLESYLAVYVNNRNQICFHSSFRWLQIFQNITNIHGYFEMMAIIRPAARSYY